METINYEEAAKQAAIDPKTRAFFADMAKMVGVSTEQLTTRAANSPWKARLYVSDRAWKLFETYRGVLHVLLMRLKQLEFGSPKDLTKMEEMIGEVKAALPHQAKFLEEHGAGALAFLVEELGSAFERELMRFLHNEPRSEHDIAQNAELMAAAAKVLVPTADTPNVSFD